MPGVLTWLFALVWEHKKAPANMNSPSEVTHSHFIIQFKRLDRGVTVCVLVYYCNVSISIIQEALDS